MAWRTTSSASLCASAVRIAYLPDSKQMDERVAGVAKLLADTRGAKLAPVNQSPDDRPGDSERRTHFVQGKK